MSSLISQQLQSFYKVSPMREGILNWYPFESSASVLEQSKGALTSMLFLRCADVVSFAGEYNGGEMFDYVVVIDPGEIAVTLLRQYRSFLKPHGRLLLAFENPYGLQYFSGKHNQRSGLPFTFWFGESKREVEVRIKQAGFHGQKWYYPFSNHYFAREVYSQDYLPNEFLNFRGHLFIEDDYTKEFDERGLWQEVIRNGAFEFMCCSYLVEARLSGDDKPCDVDFAAITAYREREKAFITTLHNDGTVRKRAVFPEGVGQVKAIADNHAELTRLGVNVIPVTAEGDSLTMRRVDLPTLWDYWASKLVKGELCESELFSHFDRIRQSIYKASKNGRCYWELVPANCFYDERNDELTFFDQEFYWDNSDPDIAVIRAIHALIYAPQFQNDAYVGNWLSQLKVRYGLENKWDELVELAHDETRAEVFNDKNTYDLTLSAERAFKRLSARYEERAAEREKERVAERARYAKMCTAVVSLKAMGIERPIIYGYGIRGKMLRTVLEMADIDIAAIVDRSFPIVKGVPCFGSVDETKEEVEKDIVVVTPIKDADNIAAMLRTKVICHVVTIEELVNG